MRIVFFGSPAFAVPTLERLLASRHEVVGAVTQPDRPRGRGQHISEGPVKALARAHGVAVFQPEKLKRADFLEPVAALAPDLGVVAAYGRLLPEDVLRIPASGLINVHASLLPRWRGAAPVERAVMAGDAVTGVTIMRVVRELDAGPTFASVTRPIGPDDMSGDIERDLSVAGADLLMHVLEAIVAGTALETPQEADGVTYAPRLSKEEGLIEWSQPALAIHNKVRGLDPWPHAFTFLGDERLIVLRTTPVADEDGRVEAGTVLQADATGLRVSAGSGSIYLVQVQREGRRPMTAREFLSGRHVQVGDRFASGSGRE